MKRRDFLKVLGITATAPLVASTKPTIIYNDAPIQVPNILEPEEIIEDIKEPITIDFDNYLSLVDTNGKELNYNGYKRQEIFFSNNEDGSIHNIKPIIFEPYKGKHTIQVRSICVYSKNDNELYTIPIDNIRYLMPDDTFMLNTGSLNINFN